MIPVRASTFSSTALTPSVWFSQLIFSLTRYEAVIDAYLAGLEEAAEQLSAEKVAAIASVASFFVRCGNLHSLVFIP